MNIQTQVQLKPFNTLNLNAVASHYVKIQSVDALLEALDYAEQQQLNVLILSGGSNMLLPEQLHALVLHMDIQGTEHIAEDELTQTVRVGAGQPGLVGASPVQNIGAYGVEAGEFIDAVHVYDRYEKAFARIAAADCHFSYRHSIFKDDPNRYIITHVSFRLLKNADLKLNYGDLKAAVADEQTAENLQNQVIHIRQSKLPDPKQYPNVGSFFKNPVISQSEFDQIAQQFPNLPHYPQANHQVKIAAGWLIDQAGWKGKKLGMVGMFHKQALVLVNYDNAALHHVQAAYHAVQQDVFNKFHIALEPEPVLFDENGLLRPHQD